MISQANLSEDALYAIQVARQSFINILNKLIPAIHEYFSIHRTKLDKEHQKLACQLMTLLNKTLTIEIVMGIDRASFEVKELNPKNILPFSPDSDFPNAIQTYAKIKQYQEKIISFFCEMNFIAKNMSFKWKPNLVLKALSHEKECLKKWEHALQKNFPEFKYYFKLPTELQIQILLYLNITELSHVGKASKYFNQQSKHDSIWRYHIHTIFGKSNVELEELKKNHQIYRDVFFKFKQENISYIVFHSAMENRLTQKQSLKQFDIEAFLLNPLSSCFNAHMRQNGFQRVFPSQNEAEKYVADVIKPVLFESCCFVVKMNVSMDKLQKIIHRINSIQDSYGDVQDFKFNILSVTFDPLTREARRKNNLVTSANVSFDQNKGIFRVIELHETQSSFKQKH